MIHEWEGRLFVTFAAVLEEKSFSRAADRLGYVQSTVTSQIRQLESYSGKKLFHRLPRGVEPTEAGLQLAPYAYQFIKLGQSLQDALSQADIPSGILHLHALESFAVAHLPHFLSEFLKQFTQVKVHLTPGLKNEIVTQVSEHRADIGIIPLDPKQDDLLFTPLLEEKLALICSPSLQQKFERQGWSSLQDSTFISFGEQCVYHAYGRDVLHAAKVDLIAQLAFPSVELIKQTVSCGMGIAFVPESNIRAELKTGALVSLPYGEQLIIKHGIITHKAREPKSASRVFIQQLADYFGYAG